MPINYFCSGFKKDNAFEEFKEYFKQDIKKDNQIAFIPGHKNNYKKAERWRDIFCEHFAKIGYNFGSKVIINEDTEEEDAEKIILSSDVVFLLGGDPLEQMQFINEKSLRAPLVNGTAVIIGMSAGAMSMSKDIIIIPCGEEYPEFVIEKGLNLANLSIFPGANFKNNTMPDLFYCHDGQIKKSDVIVASKKAGEFYCLQDNPGVSMIREERGNVKFIGSPIFKANGKSIVKVK